MKLHTVFLHNSAKVLLLVGIVRLFQMYIVTTLIVSAMFSFNSYEDFAENVRGLESMCTKEAYDSISPDNYNNLITYRRLTSSITMKGVDKISFNIVTGETTVIFRIYSSAVGSERLFLLSTRIGVVNVSSIVKGEVVEF